MKSIKEKIYFWTATKPALYYVVFGLVLGFSDKAWAFGVPGAPSLNTAFGLVVNIFIAIIEGALMVSMGFAFWRSRHGHPEEQAKIFWHFIAMIGVFLSPEIFKLVLSIFQQSGASDAGSTWR